MRSEQKSRRLLPALRTRCAGAAGVEFALALPLVLLAFLVVIEGGRLAYTQAALAFAAQEATRYAIVREGQVTNDEIRDFAASKLFGLRPALAVVTVQSPIDPTVNTSEYTVAINYAFTPLFPYLPSGTITLAARSSGFIAFPPVLPGAGA